MTVMTNQPKPLGIQPKKKGNPEVKRKRGELANPDNYPCPVCGEADFEWGYPRSEGHLYFNVVEFMGGKNERLQARVCRSCGNVLLFLRD